MSNRKLHSITALFDTPDSIMHAAEAVRDAGYQKFDVNTPYPLHGMDDAMGLKPTLLPFTTLFFGLTGLAIAVGFQWYTSGDSIGAISGTTLGLPYWLERYPLVIGGKPLFSLPAFVPVMFELTVLLAALGTVACLIAIFCKLPANGHPLHDSRYMEATSCDRFGLCIEASDPLFDEAKVKAFLEKLGGKDIELIYEAPKLQISPVSTMGFVTVLAVIAIGASGKTWFIYNIMLYQAPWTWMDIQPKAKPQAEMAYLPSGLAMLPPVPGTVARNFMPYAYSSQPEKAGEMLSNPYPKTSESLAKGKTLYNIHCSVCHGYQASGDGRLKGQFPNPPSLHSEKSKNWNDGQFFHVITEGQNVMSGYAKHISVEDRWHIVNYIRALQRALDAKETDLQ
ncbi:MAG: DUF3341 domain-containing protein [Candidatus Cloacimonetes bacterium]|nr:DUF3341 domain-containing protein [Candidatus Cloacimonadota bacterium]